MYTYQSFETLGEFSLLRPIFITLLIVSFSLFLFMLITKSKDKLVNGFSVIILSMLCILVSGQLMFYDGIIVDEIGLSGDTVSFYLFLAILIFGITNPIIYFYKKQMIDKCKWMIRRRTYQII